MTDVTLLEGQQLTEPDDTNTILNDLLVLGQLSGTMIVLGMGVSGVTTNTEQPTAYNARLMKEPT